MKIRHLLLLCFLSTSMVGCTSVKVDQLRWEETSIDTSKETIVILGRHHSPEFETEPSLVSCLGGKLESRLKGLNVINETEFQNTLYPWFEPRTAPLTMEKFIKTLDQPLISDAMRAQNIKYMIWIEGATEKIDGYGSLSCGITPGGAGCFGFGAWEDESKYEASIWDFEETKEVGKITTDASGTSYVPAVVVPIPLLARVQANACSGMGEQLSSFLQPSESS